MNPHAPNAMIAGLREPSGPPSAVLSPRQNGPVTSLFEEVTGFSGASLSEPQLVGPVQSLPVTRMVPI